jgi:hypothetical protein
MNNTFAFTPATPSQPTGLLAQRLSGEDPWHDARTGADDLPEDDNVQPAV